MALKTKSSYGDSALLASEEQEAQAHCFRLCHYYQRSGADTVGYIIRSLHRQQ